MRKWFVVAVVLYIMVVAAAVQANAFGWPRPEIRSAMPVVPEDSLPYLLAGNYAGDPTYVGDSTNAWLRRSFVVRTGETTIDIVNRGRNKVVHDAVLIVAVRDLAQLDAITVLDQTLYPSDFAYGTPRMQCSGWPIDPHGIFPARYATVELGDVPPRGFVPAYVRAEGSPTLTVNVMAIGHKRGSCTNSCVDVISPFNADTTLVGGALDPNACTPGASIRMATNADVVRPGSQFYYQLYWASTGTCDLTDVTVEDALPTLIVNGAMVPGVTVTNAYPAPSYSDPYSLLWDLGDRESWDLGDMLFEVTVSGLAQPGATLTNTACVDAGEIDPVCQSMQLGIDDGQPDN